MKMFIFLATKLPSSIPPSFFANHIAPTSNPPPQIHLLGSIQKQEAWRGREGGWGGGEREKEIMLYFENVHSTSY
jgi:hypothetical protein